MAGALMSSGGGHRRGRRGGPKPVSDINVTPLVDVMLVLLIVFMVTAPLLTVSVPVDLPKANAQSAKQDKEPLVISIDAKGRVYLQDTATDLGNLVSKLKSVTKSNPDARIFVRGDKGIAYGQIMEVMGTINAAGYSKVALVAELPTPPPPEKKKKK